jgi:hypothetical protein
VKTSPLITSFNAGELSPLIGGRPDLEKYRAGLSLCENLIPRVQGALQRRGGTRFVSEVKDSADRTWLVDFVFSATDAFVLEFGDQYLRFYRDRGVLESSPGVPYEIATPYALADLTDEDGAFALKYVQSGDVVYLAHPSYAPRKLTRVSNTSWTLEELTTVGGPFLDQNTDKTVKVYVSSGTGVEATSVTLTASSGIFEAGHVGGLFYLELADAAGVLPWEPGQKPSVNDKRTSDGKHYKCTSVPAGTYNTGGNKPIHTYGKAWDGDGLDRPGDSTAIAFGVEWEFLHPGYGWVEITGFTSATVVTATVLSTLPSELTSSANASWRWALGAWSDAEGWPNDVTFFRERLTFAKGQQLDFSVAGDFENFKAKDFGQTTAASALRINIQSGRGDPIRWLAPGAALVVGTGGGELAVREQATNQAFGPGNAKADPQGEWGSRGVAPAVVGGSVLHVEKSGRAVRELAYDLNADGYVSLDTTRFAEHLFSTAGIVDMAFARQPHELLWCVRDDGYLLALTFNKAEGVSGWHRQPIAGDGIVESVCSIPAPDGARDDLWLIVRRTIDGSTKRYVEYVTAEYRTGDDAALWTAADSSLLYDGAPTSTVSGLDHLEGEAVSVKADGAAHADKTVSGGQITLDRSASKVAVGLASPARGQLMALHHAGVTRVYRAEATFLETLGVRFGADFDSMERIEFRSASDPMDEAPPLYTGRKKVSVPGDFAAEGSVAFECDQDFPFCLVMLRPEAASNAD